MFSIVPLQAAIQFLDILEQQFPIEQADQPFQIKTAQAFADKLAVHVIHLNRTVKQVTLENQQRLILSKE